MIQNIEKGSGFKGAAKYILEKEESELIGGTMISETVKGLTQEAAAVRSLNPKLGKAVFHASLSIGTEDNLTEKQWNEIANRYMNGMGFEHSPYIVVRHKDTDHDHIHIAALRINTETGKTVSDSKDFERGAKIIQQIEIDYGLTRVAQTSTEARKKAVKNLKRNELEMVVRTGQAAPRQVLQELVDEAKKDNPHIFEFIDRLEMAGVEVRPAVAKTGRMNGFSFKYNDIAFKASDLGKNYGWKKLSESVSYEQDRDSKKLIDIGITARDRANQDNSGISESDRINVAINDELSRGEQRATGSIEIEREKLNRSVDRISNENERNLLEDAGFISRAREISLSSKFIRDKDTNRDDNRLEKEPAQNKQDDTPHQFSIITGIDSRLRDMAAPTELRREKSDEVVSLSRARNSTKNIRDNERQAPDHIKKIATWERQHAALQAPQYRLTIVPRRDKNKKTFNLGKQKDSPEVFYSANDVKKLIPQLRRFNAIGHDIYITPIDDMNHYILLDDATKIGVEALKKRGLMPILVQESSDNNIQAIYKADKETNRKKEQSDANAMMSTLNKKYGDEKISAVVHPFRMAGFTNAKPEREIDGKRPFTQILETSEGNKKMSEWLAEIRIETDKKDLKEKSVKREKILIDAELQSTETFKSMAEAEKRFSILYKKHYGLAKKMKWEIDPSRIDFAVSKDMLIEGYSIDEVKEAMIALSPSLQERHSDTERYAIRTATKALEDQGVINQIEKAKKEEELSDNQTQRGLGM